MFKNKDKDSSSKQTSSAPSSSSGTNSLVAGTAVEGTINAANDIRIDGLLKGTLNCKGRVIIGPDGKVDGEIQCLNAVIEGKFTGKLRVTELLTVKDSANIEGDIATNKLLVQSGAVFNVNCNMGGQKVSQLTNKQAS